MQIGYCGLDKETLGAGPDTASLDITDYCEGYVSWDLLMIFIQVSDLLGCLYSRGDKHLIPCLLHTAACEFQEP